MVKGTHDPARILACRDFVPDWLRFWSIILITLVYLFSGAIQLASAGQQVGGLSFLQEDTQMIGFSAFVGMNMIFPMLFRLRFRFSTKTILTAVTIILIICHLLTLYTVNVPLLCFINFIAGTFRMLGAFETMVCIQLLITPTRSYAVFYAVIFFIVQGSAIFFSAQVAYILHYLSWYHLHIVIILLLIWTLLMVYFLFRQYRSMKKIPLYGIDWAGYALWCISLSLILFIAIYGKHYEWFHSPHIRWATVGLIGTLVLNLYHMFHVKRPYISLETWRYPNMGKLVLLFLALYISLATPMTLQNSYMAGILKFDSIHIVLLNWFVLGGMLLSVGLCYVWFVRNKYRIKPMIFVGYACVVLYLLLIYCQIDPQTNIESFYVPAVLRGIGLLLLYIVLTLYIANIVPFKHNFQALCIMGFIRMSLGTVLGSSLIDNWMHYLTEKNSLLLSPELDSVNTVFQASGLSQVTQELSRQVMMVSMKEIYGYMAMAGILILIIILLEKEMKRLNLFFPKLKKIRHIFKRAVDFDRKS